MLVKTPPMGWSSWNTFGEDINEQIVMETADAMAELGLRDLGYTYVSIDDCWALHERDAEGRMVADPAKFPSGMKALGDYIHERGLKFGIYSCAGTRTCACYPGSYEHEFVDAQTFADWGVDTLKYDFCHVPKNMWHQGHILYNRMSMALKATGRDIMFNACNWGMDSVEHWIRSTGAHMYRSGGDMFDNFVNIKNNAMGQVDKLGCSAPGCFNDLDMMVVGMRGEGNCANGGCSDREYRLHMALWCLFQSPLMLGCDLRGLDKRDPFTYSLITNRYLLAVDQDPECRPPFIPNREKERPYFCKCMADGSYTLGLFNFTDRESFGELGACMEFFDIGLTWDSGYGLRLTDMFTGEDMGLYTENINILLPPHDCRMYRAVLEHR